MAIDPTNVNRIVGVYNDYRDLNRRGYSGWSISRDAGATVQKDGLIPGMILIPGEYGTISTGSVSVAADSKGNLFLAGRHSETFSNYPNGITIARSPKAGSPTGVFSSACAGGLDPDCWPTIKAVTGNRCSPSSSQDYFDDNPFIAVDQTTGPAAGQVYVVWTRFPCSYTNLSSYIMIARCDNLLSVCTAPVVLDSRPGTGGPIDFVQQPHVAIALTGALYVTWIRHSGANLEAESAKIMLRRIEPTSSSSSVGTIGPLRAVHSEMQPLPWGFAPYPSYFPTATRPWVAVSGNRVIVIWDRRTTPDIVWAVPDRFGWWFDYGTGPSIVSRYSDNNGATWSSLQTVSAAPGPQYQPSACVDPTTGKVAIAYYSRQLDPWSGRAEDIYMAVSGNGAAPYLSIRATSASNDTQAGPRSDFSIGDRIEAACRSGVAYVHFTANYARKWFDDKLLYGYRGHYAYQQDNFLVRLTLP